MPGGEVKESRERVSAALANSGFDLSIAIRLLVATGALPAESVEGLTILGELGLDGTVRFL